MPNRPGYYEKVQPRLNEIRNWILDGDSLTTIAKKLDLNVRTVQRYLIKYEEFNEAVNTGRDGILTLVENNFYKRVLGKATVTKKKFKYIYDENGKEILESKEVIEETLVPSTADYVFFLTQYPERWKNRQYENDNSIAESIKNSKEVLDKITGALNNETNSSK